MQNKKEKVRVEMVCMNSVLIDLGKATFSKKAHIVKVKVQQIFLI